MKFDAIRNMNPVQSSLVSLSKFSILKTAFAVRVISQIGNLVAILNHENLKLLNFVSRSEMFTKTLLYCLKSALEMNRVSQVFVSLGTKSCF